jgi:uncharacterized membrane protein
MNVPETEAPAPYAVNRATLAHDAPILALLALDLAFGLVAWPRLPERVPVHWGLSGQPNGWGPAWMNAILLPAVACGTYALLLFLPLIDPSRRNYALFGDTLRFLRGVGVTFLVGVHVLVVLASLGEKVDIGLAMRIGVPLILVVIGNRFGRLRHNFFFGIRVPWTLANEEVWNRTHRMAGRLWVAGGLLLVPAAFLRRVPGFAVFVAGMLVLSIVPIVYSAVIFRKVSQEGSETS